ncbi:MAG: amidase [Verrucomicrobia bacterium]|nr:amidase [Verrucomicrobiota bacterium]
MNPPTDRSPSLNRFPAWALGASALCLLVTTATRAASLSTATLRDLQVAMDDGRLSSERLVTLYLRRIEAYDTRGPAIRSVITLNTNALAEARQLDAERRAKGPRGPLHGVPVVLKDLFDTRDMPTTCGFLPMKDSRPIHDATVVRRLRGAGAILLAKVNMSDWFGVPKKGDQSTVLGRTLNPYNLDLTPGGSSGGTGASLAAVFAQVGLGSETGVSIRNPTANNSLVGLAPTEGLISRAGQTVTSFHQERCGPMGRSVLDVAALTTIVAGFDSDDLLTLPSLGRIPAGSYTNFLKADGLRGARIGVFRDLFRKGPMHQEGVGLVEKAVASMRQEGAVVIDGLSLGMDLLAVLEDARLNYYEGPSAFETYFRRLGPDAPIRSVEELVRKGGDLLKTNISRGVRELGPLTHDPGYLARLKTRHSLRASVIRLMDAHQLDALVYPFKSVPPEGHLETQPEKDNPLSSVTGLPALLVPAGYIAAGGGPIAVEFLGRPFDEPVLFRIGHAFEQATHHRKHPQSVPPLEGEDF